MLRGAAKLVGRVRELAERTSNAAPSDRDLLDAFTRTGDQDAFAVLVRRHGALVLGVCRRVLGHTADAEDAFQATFLVLARRAGAISWREGIKNWLYGVACRIALKARTRDRRRRQHERAAGACRRDTVPSQDAWCDLRAVLDEELARLPAEYRAPLLLCYLEGKTRDEAAGELGWAPGSVKGRLERGRDLLRTRLIRRGVTLGAALCASMLGEAATAAPVPAALASATVRAATSFLTGAAAAPSVLSLAQEALRAMLFAKLKTAVLLIVTLGLLPAGVTWGLHGALAQRPPAAEPPPARERPRQDGQAPRDRPRDVGKREPRRGGDRRPDQQRALLKALDAKQGSLTCLVGGDGGRTEVTYSLAGPDIKVTTVAGRALKLTDLRPGLVLLLTMKGEDEVAAIEAALPIKTGVLRQMNAEKRTVTIIQGREDADPLPLDPQARLSINGRAVTLKDLTVGMRVQATLDFDGKRVVALTSIRGDRGRPVGRDGDRDRPPTRGERDGDRNVRTFGVLIDLDTKGRTVRLLVGRGDDQAFKDYTIAKDATVHVAFDRGAARTLPLEQLVKPLNVTVDLGADGKSITAIHAAAPVVRGTLKAIDARTRHVTITQEGRVLTLPLADGVNLATDREAPTPGANVLLGLSLDRRQVVGLRVLRGDGRPER